MDSGQGKSATVLTEKIMPEYRILTKAEKAVLEAARSYAHAHAELRVDRYIRRLFAAAALAEKFQIPQKPKLHGSKRPFGPLGE